MLSGHCIVPGLDGNSGILTESVSISGTGGLVIPGSSVTPEIGKENIGKIRIVTIACYLPSSVKFEGLQFLRYPFATWACGIEYRAITFKYQTTTYCGGLTWL